MIHNKYYELKKEQEEFLSVKNKPAEIGRAHV